MKKPLKPLLFVLAIAVSVPVSLPALAQNKIDQVLGQGARADQVPTTEAGRYYQPGAAAARDNISPSSYSNVFNVGAHFRADFAYSCGNLNFVENIEAEVRNLGNKLRDTVKKTQAALIAAASGAVSSFTQYALMKINPVLGELTTKQLDEYIDLFELKVKQCRDFERDLANGKNPLGELMQVAVGQRWKQTIGIVKSGKESLEEAEATLIDEAIKQGVQMADGKYYGGLNQKPINITQSLLQAGMNLNIGNKDLSSWDQGFSGNDKDHPVLHEFKNPKELYEFIKEIYGATEKKLSKSADNNEEVNTIAGRGYELTYTKYRDEYLPVLRELVDGNINLEAFTQKTGQILPLVEVDDIRRLPPYERAVEIESRAQRYGIERLRKNLIFAKQALKSGINSPDLIQSGMRVPAEDEYRTLYYKIQDDIREIGQRAYQY